MGEVAVAAQLKALKKLTSFIADVRSSTSAEQEQGIVENELITLRSAFLSTYPLQHDEIKILLLKCLYIWTIGYDISDLLPAAETHSLTLMNSDKIDDKLAGCRIWTCISDAKPDRGAGGRAVRQPLDNCLSLNIISNLETDVAMGLAMATEIIEGQSANAIMQDIQNIANPANPFRPGLRKKAYMAMLRCAYRSDGNLFNPEQWSARLAQALAIETLSGPLTACACFLHTLIGQSIAKSEASAQASAAQASPVVSGVSGANQWIKCATPVAELLIAATNGTAARDGEYHGVHAPWLRIKLIQILEFFPNFSSPQLEALLLDTLEELPPLAALSAKGPNSATANSARANGRKAVTPPGSARSTGAATNEDRSRLNAANAQLSVGLECIKYAIEMEGACPPTVSKLLPTLCCRFIGAKDSHLRYLGLDMFGRMKRDNLVCSIFKRNLQTILAQLEDPDLSIRQQIGSLATSLCDESSWNQVVTSLLAHLDNQPQQMTQEITLKVAVLAERYARDSKEYIDTIFRLLQTKCGSVDDTMWHRVIYLLTGFSSDKDTNKDAQIHAVKRSLEILEDPKTDSGPLLDLTSYIVGEMGYLCPAEQRRAFVCLSKKHKTYPSPLLLMALVKCETAATNSQRPELLEILDLNSRSTDPELQQRAVELRQLFTVGQRSLLDSVFSVMPAYPESKRRSVSARLGNSPVGHSTPVLRTMKSLQTETPSMSSVKTKEFSRRRTTGAISGQSPRQSSSDESDPDSAGSTSDASVKKSAPLAKTSMRSNSTRQLSPSRAPPADARAAPLSSRLSSMKDTSASGGRGPQSPKTLLSKRSAPIKTSSLPSEENVQSQLMLAQLLESAWPFKGAAGGIGAADDQRSLWRRMCLLESGPLVITPQTMEIQVDQKYRKQFGRMLFTIRNISATTRQPVGLEIMFAALPQIPQLVFRIPQPLPQPLRLVPGQEGKIAVDLQNLQPLAAPPVWNWTIRVLGRGQVHLRQGQVPMMLPVAPFKFIEPIPMDAEQFKQAWVTQGQQTRDAGDVRPELSVPLAPCHKWITSMDDLALLLASGLNLSTCRVGDATICGSGLFHTGTPAPAKSGQSLINIRCLARVDIAEEPPGLKARITFRCGHRPLAEMLLRISSAYILAPHA